MKKLLLKSMVVLMFLASQAFAQNRTITGTVTGEEDGLALPGVNVKVKGTTTGTQTDASGKFSLNVAPGAKTLVFSFIGYSVKEVAIGASSQIRVSLTSNSKELGEVVVVGYGTQLRKDVTGSQASIKGADFTDRAIPSFDKDLAGKATGVQVNLSSGLLGVPATIRIRGTSSINNGVSPLYVIDGVPVPVANSGDVGGFTPVNALGDLNPNDIESFEVLKDGAATAIYGSRAANGVILINTKRGKAGKTVFTYDGYYATAKVSKKFDLLDADQFIAITTERFNNAGQVPQAKPLSDGNGGFVNTDWQSYIFKRANQQSHSISASGGTDAGKYFFSLGYSDQKGIVISNALQRISFRGNFDQKVNKVISMGINTGITYQQNTGPSTGGNTLAGDIFGTIRMLPNVPIFNPADPTGYNISADRKTLGIGANLSPISDGVPNQVFELEQNVNRSNTYRIVGNGYIQLDLLPGLKFKSLLGLDEQLINDFTYTDPRAGSGVGNNGSISQAFTPNTSWDVQNILSYNKSFNNAHNLDVTLVSEYQKSRSSFYQASVSNLSDIFFNQNIQSATFVTPTAAGSLATRSIESYVGRLNYNYKSRYYIGGSIREDKLSQLSADQRTGYFPGVSVAYRISEEPFFKGVKALSFISDLRFRASYANVGNVDIGSFPYLGLYGAAAYAGQSGIGYSQAGNADLKWEKQGKTDVGIDIGLLDGRFSLVTAYYRQDSKDLILAAPTPPSLGVPSNSINLNVGSVRNSGYEIQLSGEVVRAKGFSWNSTINFSTQKNVVVALFNNQDQFPTLNSGSYNIRRVGEPINAIYGYQYMGVNPANGNPLYLKANGQIIQGNVSTSTYFLYDPANPGVLGASSTLSSTADRSVLGNILPTYYGGFNNTVTYKDFDLNVFLRFSGGNKIYDRSRADRLNQNFVNNGTEILGRWQSAANPGDGVTPKQYASNGTFINLEQSASTRFLEDGSYLKLDNIALGYRLPKSVLKAVGISRLRFYVSGQNLVVISGYKGLDPETTSGGGVDFNGNPQQRTYTFGVNLGF